MRAAVVLTVVLALAGFERAEADVISYSESIVTDGVLGGTAFTGQTVTLTFTADTSNVTFFQGSGFTQYTNVPSVSTVSVAGIGTAVFSDPVSLSVLAFPTFSEFSVTDTADSTDILDTFAVTSGFAGYGMTTSIGPVSGGAAYSTGTLFQTSLGNFEFTKSGGGVSSVTAAVPEPSGFVLMSVGFLGLLGWRKKDDAACRLCHSASSGNFRTRGLLRSTPASLNFLCVVWFGSFHAPASRDFPAWRSTAAMASE